MRHRIAVIPGDGIGKEVLPEGIRVLDAAGRRFGFDFEWKMFDWSCETLREDGSDDAGGRPRSASPFRRRSSSARWVFPACPTTSRCGAS